MRRRKHWISWSMMIVLILGMWGCASNNEENATEEIEIVAVERGSLVTAVSCSGRVQPRTEVSLGFGIGGRINEVAVEAGSHVEAGDILARLDTTDLEFEVQSAAAALASAQAQLAQVKAGARPEEIAAAEAQYRSALAQYRKVRTGPSEEELTIAEADLKKAQAALEQAQAAYDPISWRPDAGLFPQALNLEQATLSYRQALANYELVKKGAASEDKEVAWRNAENAEAQLDMLRAGPTPEQIAVAEVAVEQAEIALEAARYQLTKATLVAPRAGIVDQIGIDAGEFVAPQAPVITLIDDEEFRIEADIDEIDVGWVEPGQKVRVTLDAFPGRTLEGKIVRIATTANADAGGVISYRATVSVAPQTLPIRGGMTANTEIVRDSAEDVLLIPNRAIWIDTDTGKPFVEKLVGEEIVITSIEQGLANEEMSEITRGLEDGEKLVVRDVSIRERFRNVVTTSMTGD